MTAAENQLADFLEFLCDELRAEIKAQGHEDTGELVRSIRYEIKHTGNSLSATIFAAEQMDYVNRKLRFRGVSRAQITALTAWWKRKGKNEKQAKSAAWATAKAHEKQGMPTRGSYAFSKNNRRIGALQNSVDQGIKDFDLYFKTSFKSAYMRNLLTNITRNINNNG
jgi:hypothetical protein